MTVRLLANENIPLAAVQDLRAAGHDVARVREDAPGSPEQAVLRRAVAEARILVTFDKDFGELARTTPLPQASGLILLRLPMQRTQSGGALVAAVIDSRRGWAGHFSVVEPTRNRMRALPRA